MAVGVLIPPPVKLVSATHDWTATMLPQSMSFVAHAPPPLHSRGDVQSALLAQLVRQPEPLQANRPQFVAAVVPHVPVPLQVRAGVKLLIEHIAPTQTVPAP
jgi:hypothetical protein